MLLLAGLLGGCVSGPSAPGAVPSSGLRPTLCEKRALMKGQAPDRSEPDAVAADFMLGIFAPESCPDPSGRLDSGVR